LDVKTIGTVESVWRYPVKSMAGESPAEIFVGFSGVYGDRCYAFKSSAAGKGFPYFNASTNPQMLLFRPKLRYPQRASKPANLSEALRIEPGVTPGNAEPGDLLLDVITPDGKVLPIDGPDLREALCQGFDRKHQLTLLRSDRALTDCRPLSLISLQTIKKIEEEMEQPVDKRRFRANIYFDLHSNKGFEEDELVGRKLRLGQKLTIAVLERDPRCKIISLDPDTGEHNPGILRKVAQNHNAFAGVYCAILVEGIIAAGDPVVLLE
jgi:MOSC domain-containing protein